MCFQINMLHIKYQFFFVSFCFFTTDIFSTVSMVSTEDLAAKVEETKGELRQLSREVGYGEGAAPGCGRHHKPRGSGAAASRGEEARAENEFQIRFF